MARHSLWRVRCVLIGGSLFCLGPSHGHAAASQHEIDRAARLANEGDPGAQVAYGILHETGDGVPQNATEAFKWYRRAAELGDAEGCFRLGWLYARGEGLPQNFEQAAHWYELAAKKDHAIAQLSLGWLYLNGNGVTRDVAQAITWFKRVADRGDANAQYTLGVIHAGAYEGVPKNLPEAARWFRLAAQQGVASAQSRLGAMYAKADGVKADAATAYFWLGLALTQLPEGTQRNDAGAMRTNVASKLGASERADLDKRIAEWKPGITGP